MIKFDEHTLEMSIIKLLEDKGYTHVHGRDIVRSKAEVLLLNDLKNYLHTRYADEDLTQNEINSIILS